ncbi:MAG: Glu/Leu/Phe/Val dehydrogenase dimerization domain-containing protein [Cytophagales bacterium]|nr:leucine dehydrogenase [Bernardetiaceae bacterium]MDW8205460.1 Glu/Leu/Phe/Val dehydrogenase dimerization domain-containing protein [Cytophagales bacterium]
MTTETQPLVAAESNIFAQIDELGHEQVVFCHDRHTGLKAIIAIHNTVLGPAMGGTRMWAYSSESAALEDALRLARGMTFKNAMAGLHLGGGKAVIIGDARKMKTEALLRMYGKFIKNLNGKYITAEDMGMTERDMEDIAQETSYVAGLPEYRGGSGSPSGMTALGTYVGMKAAAKKAFGTDSLEGKTIAVQGVGSVGEILIEYLSKEHAKIYVTDVFEERVKKIASRFNVIVVGTEEIYDVPADIYSPCAMGATINDNTLERLKAQVIAGCANNQLADEDIHGTACMRKGITYVPDFVINSGGVINIATEIAGSYNRAWATAKTEEIYDRVMQVLTVAEQQQRNAQVVATELAWQRIQNIARIKATY